MSGHVTVMCAHVQVSGGVDKLVHVWDVKCNIHLHMFRGHKDTVTVSC